MSTARTRATQLVRSSVGRIKGRGIKARGTKSRDPGTSPPPSVESGNQAALFRWCLEHEHNTGVRAHYLWCTLQAATEARNLGVPEISLIEFGVAGGNGLIALELSAAVAERLLGVRIQVFGFDSGVGMPAPKDFRDLPWAIKPAYFSMDEEALRRRLSRAQLVLGPVADTVNRWLLEAHPPVGFVAFDLDYYSSTVDALRLLDSDDDRFLPRIPCYFDDILGYGWNDFNGERAAISEFNESHENRKLAYLYGLRYEIPQSLWHQPWHEQIYIAHLFDHRRYNEFSFELPRAFLEAHRLSDQTS